MSLKRNEMKDENVDYFLYPKLELSSAISNEESLSVVSNYLKCIKSAFEELSSKYLWHNEAPEFRVYSCSHLVCMGGSLNYGENIEDEWFLVYALIQLTVKFDDLIVRIKDGDGELLLIEAAENLPSWVSPETCEDKVFLHRGHLHILPRQYTQSEEDRDDEEPFEITDSVLEYIRTNPNESRVKPAVEAPIFRRIGNYPEKISSIVHEAVVFVPVGVAALLEQEPSLVTSAVRAFYYRDMIDLRACRAMKFFPPEERVLSCVRFTKCSYAMLVSSKFQPDKVTGWNLPHPTDHTYKAHLLGIKLACGFEILLNQARSHKTGSSEDLSFDDDWKKFKSSLNANNYFRGLLEHSKEYNELLNTAQNFYRNFCQNERKTTHSSRVAEIFKSIEVDVEKLKRKEAELSIGPEDDSWMDVSKDDLDNILASRFGGTSDMVDIPNGQPNDIAQHLNAFISHMSGVEGAEFPNKSVPQRPRRKKRKNVQFSADTKLHSVTSTNEIAPKGNHVTIEPDGFMNAVQNILNFAIPDDDNYWESDGSGMSSYEDEDEIDLSGPSRDKPDKEKTDQTMVDYMSQMDKQLLGTTMSKSFVKQKAQESGVNGQNEIDDADDFKPVDIDMNALKNILMSYKTQMGEAGPAENILGPMGINFEDIDADVD